MLWRDRALLLRDLSPDRNLYFRLLQRQRSHGDLSRIISPFFIILDCVPFLDKIITLDFKPHSVLRYPSDHPLGAAFGCAVLAGLIVLEVAGGDDVIAQATGTSVTALRRVLQFLVFVVLALVFAVVYALCVVARRKRAKVSASAPERASAA